MTMKLDQSYWEARYQNEQTGWDVGEITTPLREYIEQLKNKDLKILIPGAGNAYEAEYLHKNGFTNVTVIDLAQQPLKNIKMRNSNFPDKNLIQGNFFDLNDHFELILEQTFFCAIDPSERAHYAKKMAEILVPGGKLVGVLFDTEFEGGPPFGGSKDEYLNYFSPYFQIKTFEKCYNSIKPRQDRELFIQLIRK